MEESATPQIRYGSKAYKFLCYGKMKNGPFTLEQARLCISGTLCRSKNHIYDTKILAANLKEKNLLNYIPKEDKWFITELGKREIINTASFYRTQLERNLGPRFMTMVRQDMTKTYEIGPYMSQAQMDAEDLVIERVNKKIDEINKRKQESANRKKNK